MKTETVLSRLASLIIQRSNCIESGNTLWRNRCEETIKLLIKERLPSGSGWDNGTEINLDASNECKIVFHGEYHHMNDGGFYDGWTNHSITVRPSFINTSGSITISGPNRNDIKEYLYQTFDACLSEPMDEAAYRKLCEVAHAKCA